ncbi:EVE domain-containing protein [Spirosoma sp. KCTC 42546]|uniref:AAA family ATPase n=1 Tax=Spirosoma sp. KCTC 42546 TaxID=2520506 RepID=UPI00115B1FF6|nr:AAA family ATPase [Spirosoma sp. KCTC 42546]QDK80721.1 EVE domain-containing protein [Spirosoma sp. KCTC 42546]
MAITDYHRAVFDFLETYRSEHPEAELTYLLRQKNKAGRPRNVYLFSGDDHYISIGLYLPVSNNNKTRSVTLCLGYDSATNLINYCRLMIVFDDPHLMAQREIYDQIIQQIGPDKFRKIRGYRYEHYYTDPDWKVNISTFLDEHRVIIENIIRESGSYDTFHVPKQELEESIKVASQPVVAETVADVNYWVFLGSPSQFRIVKSLEDNALRTWRVTAHSQQVKVGDNVILWVTGTEAGCYALAEVVSEVYTGLDEVGEQPYQLTGFAGESAQRVKIKVLLNLWNQPVTKADIQGLPAFADFKGGNQGTNFTATQEQFETIERLARSVIPIAGRRFWKYSPGSQTAGLWNDVEERIMAIYSSNYDIGPLDQYNTLADLDNYTGKSDNTPNETLNMMMFRDSSIGDVIIANWGQNKVVGIGLITGPYQYRDDTIHNRHFRAVDWLADKEWLYTENQFPGIKRLFQSDTFSPILFGPQIIQEYVKPYPQYRQVFEKHGLLNIIQPEAIMPSPKMDARYPKNIILYGPPGTGKTYETINLAVDIIDGKEKDDRKTTKARFDQLRKEGQIEFVTFHQNYTYEDFVMGLKPDVTAGNLQFEQREGIFYKMAKLARANYEDSLPTRPKISLRAFEKAFNEYIKAVRAGNEMDLKSSNGGKFRIADYQDKYKALWIKVPERKTRQLISIITLGEMYRGIKSIDEEGPYYEAIIKGIQELGSYDSTSEPIELKNYVLIIDEINRANMSRVFGELITLLEDDKRLGGDNELTVTLPSGELFSVPPNLYLIGTMNTADKSLALLDIALRRRFEFIYKKPEAHLLEPDLEIMLNNLNRSIRAQHKSADFLIGHAYFIGKTQDQLNGVFNNRVIPLLMEYFNGNAKTVIGILDKAGVKAVQDEITDQLIVS